MPADLGTQGFVSILSKVRDPRCGHGPFRLIRTFQATKVIMTQDPPLPPRVSSNPDEASGYDHWRSVSLPNANGSNNEEDRRSVS